MPHPKSVQTDGAQGCRADPGLGWTRGLARRLRAFGAGGGLDRPAAQQTARFVPLRAVEALDPLVERSHAEPVIVFQHDPFCPISRRAQRELTRLPIEAALVDVARDGAVSRLIEQRTGVPHESPQVLVFRAGRVVWSASHFGITRGAVARALQPGSSPQPEPTRGPACGRRDTAPIADDTLLGQPVAGAGLMRQLRRAWDSQ